MRRTTHFYVMVTSLCMLLLKGTRSDQAGDKGDKCVKQENYNSSLSTLNINDLKLDLEKYNVECIVDSLPVKASDGKEVRSSDLDDIVEEASYYKDTTPSSSSRHTVIASSRHSERRIVQDASRRYAKFQDIRRTDNRRDTLNRRHSFNLDREIRTRREVRGEHIRNEGRRRLGSIDRQTALRRLNLQARNRRERRTLTCGNRESRNSEELRRNNIDNMQSNTRRVNQRNSQLFERRENRDALTTSRKVRDVERRNGQTYRNDLQSNNVIRNSRQESREIRQDDKSRRSFRNIDNRRDRRDNRESSDIRIRHTRELKQGNQFRSSHDDRIVIRERHELSNERENREIDVVRRESRRIVNAGTKPSDRSVDNMRYVRKREISARSKVKAQSAVSREMSQIARLDDVRRLISNKRDRRDVRRYDGENYMRDNNRQIRTYNNREINAVRGMGYKQDSSFEHGWNMDGIGITRAIVVGFVGILGRKIWQKQA
ncbi:zinc finger CCCH domain-containing protein 13-like isoform X2 [Ruditapes philippinarum]|uniref:zinc finger CCCH domain-containing protein 13-like isoform X2 n=1 Tax=Ruditapes philippinarum TaxID=129788 RepID=UPI00295B9CAE|nr:zinc finger CCCH domain-containing protein 13-like isoform X2 [Ruditapes philippinarum]